MRARSFRSRLQHDLVAARRPGNVEGMGDDPFTVALIARPRARRALNAPH